MFRLVLQVWWALADRMAGKETYFERNEANAAAREGENTVPIVEAI